MYPKQVTDVFKKAFMFSRRRKIRYTNKKLAYFHSWVNYSFRVNKAPNIKRKITVFNTVSLIGINLVFYLFICSFSFMNAPAKYTHCSLPENKTLFILLVYYVICNVYLCSNFFYNKEKIMTTIFIFTHFGLNICHTFKIFCYLALSL